MSSRHDPTQEDYAASDLLRLRQLSALTVAGRLFRCAGSPARFLLIFLRGGYDCANFLIPYASSYYYESRPHIAIPRPDASAPTGAVALTPIGRSLPGARDPRAALQQRQLAFVPFAGTDDLSRSHFETQDEQSNSASPPAAGAISARDSMDAWCRFWGSSGPIAFTDALPLTFRAAQISQRLAQGVGKPAFDERQTSLLTACTPNII